MDNFSLHEGGRINNLDMDSYGQLTAEFLFIIAVLLTVVVASSIFILGENELNIAMEAARNGVIEGLDSNCVSVYPDKIYRDYENSKEGLLELNSVKLVKINYTYMGYDENYGKEKIQFNVTVTGDVADKTSVGDRINYYLRKSLATSFNSTDSTNDLYNPVFSDHYIFTTANVKWI